MIWPITFWRKPYPKYLSTTDVTMKLTYSDLANNWINLHIEAENIQYTLYVSSLANDCILELLNATIQLQRQSDEEFVVFWEEPSSYIWRLKRENDWVIIQRYFLKDYIPIESFTTKYLNDAEIVDSFAVEMKTLTNQVIRFVGAFQDSPGIERYADMWNHEFPANKLKCLKGLRRTAERHLKKGFVDEVSIGSQFARAIQLLRSLVASQSLQIEPPFSQDFIDAVCSEFNLTLPLSIVEWLTYCNGMDMAFGYLNGIDEVTNFCNREHISHWKERGWIPIAGDGCGNYYLVVKYETQDESLYPVVFVDHEDSAIGENGENQLCNRISYIVASDLPHFLEVVLLYQEHHIQYQNKDDDEYPDFWWPFDKERMLQFDPNIDKIEIIKPWD